ncbi:MAG TPA: DUF4388 domain-containing protein [Thermoanaerobaculia bacterium]|jgi:hypothetical protein|nr:DUF4388 domain-containing protein [Thermoanaerobaculia bacterium]
MAVEGTLDLFKLPEILQLISQQKKTGILTVQGQQDIVAISFLKGRIVAADALNQTLEEGLSQILHKEGLVSAPDLARAVSEHQSAGGRLIDLLVDRRYIERSRLLEALRLQTWRLLEQLLRWTEGDFKFYSGDEVSYEEGFDPISVEELLINAAPAEPAPRPAPAPAPAPVPAPAAAPPARSAVAPVVPLARPAVQPAPAPAPPSAPAPRPMAVVKPMPAPAPEEEASGPFRKMKVEPRPTASPALGWVGRVLAAGLAALAVATLLRSPDSFLLPFPWQEHERESLAREERTALDLKIDHAAKTWFLLRGSFPDRLEDLVAAGLLSRSDLKDPQGRRFLYAANEDSYTLEPAEGGKPVPDAQTAEAITGNFLLDPEFLNVPSETNAQPLVLLD